MTDDVDDLIDDMDDAVNEDGPDAPEEPDESGDESGSKGLLDGIMPPVSGTGKSLEAYEDSPYRSLAGGAGGDPDAEELRRKGELHIARGADGLIGGFVDAGHPFVDLAIGFFLIMLAGRADGSSGDSEGYDGSKLGGGTMDDTPGDDLLTGED